MYSFINESVWIRKDNIWIHQLNQIDKESSFEYWQADEIRKYEDVSWWYIYRKKLLYLICKRYFSPSEMVVDIGGGNGVIADYLRQHGFNTSLIEPAYKSCEFAMKRGVKNIFCGTVDDISIKNNSISQAMLLDVVEHIEDDNGFYRMIIDKLKPGGRLLITVPAFMTLWSSEDVGSGHYKRYTLEDIHNLVKGADNKGRIIFENYFFGFLYYPVLFGRVLSEKIGLIKRLEDRDNEEYKKERDRQYVNKSMIVERFLEVFEKYEMDNILEKRIRRGSSLVVVVEKY